MSWAGEKVRPLVEMAVVAAAWEERASRQGGGARRISVSRAWFEMFDRYPSKGGNGSAKEELSRLLLRGKLNVQ